MDNIKIKRKKKPVLINGKLKREGKIYYEIAIWDGYNWSYLKEEPKTEKEAYQIAESKLLNFGKDK